MSLSTDGIHIILSTTALVWITNMAECRGRKDQWGYPNPTTYHSVTVTLFHRNNECQVSYYLQSYLSFAPLYQHLRVATIISGSAGNERGQGCWPLAASKLCVDMRAVYESDLMLGHLLVNLAHGNTKRLQRLSSSKNITKTTIDPLHNMHH